MVIFHGVCGHWHFKGDNCYPRHLEEAYQKRLKELEEDK